MDIQQLQRKLTAARAVSNQNPSSSSSSSSPTSTSTSTSTSSTNRSDGSSSNVVASGSGPRTPLAQSQSRGEKLSPGSPTQRGGAGTVAATTALSPLESVLRADEAAGSDLADVEPYPTIDAGARLVRATMERVVREMFGRSSTIALDTVHPLAERFEQWVPFSDKQEVSVVFLPLLETAVEDPSQLTAALSQTVRAPARYFAFLQSLGELTEAKAPPTPELYIWQAEMLQFDFLVHHAGVFPPLLRPSIETPVCIVYCDDDWEDPPDLVRAVPVVIVVQPLSVNAYRVWVRVRDASLVATASPEKPTMVTNSAIANYVRQLALKFSLALRLQRSGREGEWEQRTMALRHLQTLVQGVLSTPLPGNSTFDFPS